MSEQESAPALEAIIDWRQARQTLRRHIVHHLADIPQAEVEDLTQEALVDLLRASRRGGVREPGALMFTIAQRTAIDYVRRERRWRLLLQDDPTGEHAENCTARAWMYGDAEQRIRFLVLQFFRDRNSSCLELAHGYFDERDWAAVARATGASHDGVRKRWSRCLAVLRQFISRDRLLAKLADCFEE